MEPVKLELQNPSTESAETAESAKLAASAKTTIISIERAKPFKPLILVLCVLALLVVLSIDLSLPTGRVAADDPPVQPTPPRGLSEDLWSDVVIGQPSFSTIAPNETTSSKLDWANGVIEYTDPNQSQNNTLFIYDSGNNRILGVNVLSCMSQPGNANCQASLVIAQKTMREGGCNHDSGFQNFPFRTLAGADTLCGQPEHVTTLSETGSGASMALDDQGRLWVTDYFNHRVLRYPKVYAPTLTPTATTPTLTPTATTTPPTPTPTSTPIRADVVIGQVNALGTPDFTGNKCNGILPNPFAIRNSKGDIVEPLPPIPDPNDHSLCFDWGGGANGVLGNNWIAGVDVVPPTASPGVGYVWVADSGNNRVLRFQITRDSTGVDTYSSYANAVLGQTSFTSRTAGTGDTGLTDPSVVRVDKRTGKVYVIDQIFDPSRTNQYSRVQAFGPTINPTPIPNPGTLIGYWHQPWGLNFDTHRPDHLWISANLDNNLEAWKIPTEAPTPVRAQILGLPGRPSGSIGMDDQNDPLNLNEWLFTSASAGQPIQLSDVFAFGVPRSDPETPVIPAPTKSLFGYGDSPWGNKITTRELAEGNGVVVTDNPQQNQMIIGDSTRLLFWNNPTSAIGDLSVTNGITATGVITYASGPTMVDTYNTLKATRDFLYVSVAPNPNRVIPKAHIDIYQLPVTENSKPISSLTFPFETIGTPIPIDHDFTVHPDLAIWGLAPTSDNQFLWVSNSNDSRVFRVRNPLPPVTATPTATGTPPTVTPTVTQGGLTLTPTITPTRAKVDVILGQSETYNNGCNTQKVTAWPSATRVTITGNTIEKTSDSGATWDAGARSLLEFEGPIGTTDSGYAQMTVDQTDKDRAFGLSKGTPTYNYTGIDFAYRLMPNGELRIYERGTPIPTVTPLPTYVNGDVLRVSVEIGIGPSGWGVRYYKNSTLLYTSGTPIVSDNYPLHFDAAIYSPNGRISNAYLASSMRRNVADNTLCLPGALALDRQGNLWISDDSLESAGNQRLLEFDATQVPVAATRVISDVAARRLYPNTDTWEPAFDNQNRMVVGYNPYGSVPDFPYSPTPTLPPGTPTPDSTRFVGRFPGVYNNPLYPTPGVGTPNPATAPTPNTLLSDFYSQAFSATFDQYDNLYIRDLNRGKVMIYRHPFYGTPVTWATPLVNVTVTPTSNSIQKNAGTDEVWNAGAVSAQAIGSGDGYVLTTIEDRQPYPPPPAGTDTPTYTPTPTATATATGTLTPTPSVFNKRRAFGLSQSSEFHAHRLQDVDYAFVLTGTNTLAVYERGLSVANVGTYDYNDVLKVAVESGTVKYYKNGVAVYTSTVAVQPAAYPLLLDTSIATMGGRIYNAFISGQNIVTCSSAGWCTSLSPNNGTGSNVLNGVAVLAPDNIWAVGGSSVSGQSSTSLVEHWNGTAWQIIAINPFDDVGVLHGVSAVDASHIWAVGDRDILFYNGTSWSSANTNQGGNGVYAQASNNVFAVGDNSSGHGILHFDGTSWSTETAPSGGILNGVVADAASNGWAVGYTVNSSVRSPLTLQRSCAANGVCSWASVTNPPLLADGFLNSIDKLDPSHIWAVGSYYLDLPGVPAGYRTLTEYWNGSAWSIVTSPNHALAQGGRNELHSVWFGKEGDVWASGEYSDYPSDPFATQCFLMHWNDAYWEEVLSPHPGLSSNLVAVGSRAGSSAVITQTWAVGNYAPYYGAPSQTLVEYIRAPAAPSASTSYFETTVDGNKSYGQGCAAVHNTPGGIIMLNYGQPRYWGTATPGATPDPTLYGTMLIGTGDKAFIADIAKSVEYFGQGYFDCSPSGHPHVTIAIGLNNNNKDGHAELTHGHADAWAAMVSDVLTYSAKYLGGGIDIAAGMDVEPDWSAYAPVYDWLKQYNYHPYSLAYNFGGTDGYPTVPTGTPTPVVPPPWACCSAWTVDQLYTISWGIPGMRAFPSIYHPQWSRDWYRVKRWSNVEASPTPLPMAFTGAMSESYCLSGHCQNQSGVVFNPEQAWQTFWLELNADPDARIQQDTTTYTYSSDIKCSNGSNNQDCKP